MHLFFQGSSELGKRQSADSVDLSQAGSAVADSADQAGNSKAADSKPTLAHADSSLSSEVSGNSHSGAMPMEVDDDAMFQKKAPKGIKTESAQVRLAAMLFCLSLAIWPSSL